MSMRLLFSTESYCFSRKKRINILRRYLPFLRNQPPITSVPQESTDTPSPHSVGIKISFCDTIVSSNRPIWGISTAIPTCEMLDVGCRDHHSDVHDAPCGVQRPLSDVRDAPCGVHRPPFRRAGCSMWGTETTIPTCGMLNVGYSDLYRH